MCGEDSAEFGVIGGDGAHEPWTSREINPGPTSPALLMMKVMLMLMMEVVVMVVMMRSPV